MEARAIDGPVRSGKKIIIGLCGIGAVLAAAALLPVGGGVVSSSGEPNQAPSMDLSAFSDAKPDTPLRLVFLHHSVGGQLLADEGPDVGENSIHPSHPSGGGLRRMLEAQGYEVHEASYGSRLGEHTDMFDWLPKFRGQMDAILANSGGDSVHAEGQVNEIVVFKSCFTQSWFVGEGTSPGDPDGPALTVGNAKATLRELLPEFAKHPETLFVYVTAPPLAPKLAPIPAWTWLAKLVLGKPVGLAGLRRAGDLDREFNNWVKSPSGWLDGYAKKNVVVFDYYDVLTGKSGSNFSAYPTGDGSDSHPSAAGNQQAAREFVPFLNRAVRRAGLGQPLDQGNPLADQ